MATYEYFAQCQDALAEIKLRFRLGEEVRSSEELTTHKIQSLHSDLASRVGSLRKEYEAAVGSRNNAVVNSVSSSLRSMEESLGLFPLDPILARAQVDRIKTKLQVAQRQDLECMQHGAKKHRYKMGAPFKIQKVEAVELEVGRLPAGFRLFLKKIGSGPAGPGYGLYPLDRLSKDTLDAPDFVELDGLPALSISHVGCAAESLLVVAGPYAGCVYNSDSLFGRSPPSGPRFLDWYEAWLDFLC